MAKSRSKVLVDLERTRYPQTGLGYYCQCLEGGLRELELPMDLSYYRRAKPGEVDVHRWSCLHRLLHISSREYDLIHITHQQQSYFPTAFSGKCIVTLHDLNFLFESLSPRRYKRELEKARRNLNRADCIVSISHFVEQTLLAHRHLFDLKPNVVFRVIYNGIHLPSEYTLHSSKHSDDIAELAGTRYLLSIGFLSPKKQQRLLVEALLHLPEDLSLILVYSSARADYLSTIKEDIIRLGLLGRVHLLYRISDEDKALLLSRCIALLQPSLAEGFGIPPIEAMAYGKPVILNPVTAMPEIGGDVAYYFESLEPKKIAKTIMSSVEHYDTTPQVVDTIRSWARRYDYKRMAEQYARLYMELLSEDLE